MSPYLGRLALLSLLALVCQACDGSSSSTAAGGNTTPFQVTAVDVASPWEINRPITFHFTRPVDFLSVGATTIRIQTSDSVPARGTYSEAMVDANGDGILEVDPTRIVFQPTCPIEADLSDAGFSPGGAAYFIILPGGDTGTPGVRSQDGARLEASFTTDFFTAQGEPADVLLDTKNGPPTPLLRPLGSLDPDATHIELGGDPSRRVYFEFDASDGSIQTNPADFQASLNLFAGGDERLAFVLQFDQMVSPTPENLGCLRIEYLAGSGSWVAMNVVAELVRGCAGQASGSVVRLIPRGILPQGSQVRACIGSGFADVAGETSPLPIDDFAVARTKTVAFQSLVPADVLGDELLEGFEFGGGSPLSFEDPTPPLAGGRAEWGSGRLRSSPGIESLGGGGPSPDFDWIVRSGDTFFFDTTSTIIVGGPDGIPTEAVTVLGGRLKLRNMVIEEGGEVRVVGPNPLSIQATGTVIVRGLLDLSGFNGKDVATLNTGHQPEIGAAGAAGGGHGGTASFETMMSTPRGGSGEGAFRRVGAGAQGGESGYAPVGLGKSARRPGGGGGGRFAADQGDLLSRPGGNGHPMSRGAESDLQPAMGGVPNASILVDGNPDNDYFGLKPVVEGGVLVDRLRGELRQPSAGVGGGAGGDAVPANTFPHPNWSPASDEKGGPGGGGGGQLRVRALGPIVFGRLGEIRCNGGRGGTGENTLFLDHVGGTGGSGSGGHVILETAMYVDFTDGDPGAPVGDRIRAVGGPRFNGAPTDFPEVSFGGRGGPGIIQLHVPRPERGVGPSPDVAGVVLPLEALFAQNALDEVTSPQGILLYPTVGTLSSGQSDWIPLGAADESSGGVDLVSFLFAGTETTPGPDEGRILTDDTHVRAAAPLFGPALLAAPNAEIGVDRRTLTLRGDALAFGSSGQLYNDVFLRTPALLRHFRLRLERADNATVFFDHEVAHAVYDDVEATLSITVVTNAEDLADFIENAAGGAVIYTVTPRFFRANSSLGRDRIPGGTRIRLLFQAATDDGAGNPADPPLVDWTADPRSFNSLSPGALDFFRFRVEFDLDTEGTGFDPEMAPLELDFLRLPFRF